MTAPTTDTLVRELQAGPLAALGPRPEPLDPTWSHDQLSRLLGTPVPPRRARRVVTGVALAGVLVGGTGAAYAAGALPEPLSSALRQLVPGAGSEEDVRMHRYLDLRMPDGARVTAWSGTVDGHPCSAQLSGWDGTDRMASAGAVCAAGQDHEPSRADLAFYPSRDQQRWFPVVLGETTARAARTAVVVVGTPAGPHRYSAAVDPVTGGWGVALDEGERDLASMRAEWNAPAGEEVPLVPRDSAIRSVQVTLLDAEGRVVEREQPLPPG